MSHLKRPALRIPITVRLPEDLVLKCDLLLMNDNGRTEYGTRQRLIEHLLQEWANTQISELTENASTLSED